MDDICTLKYFCGAYSHLATENQIRWWIFNRHANGIESAGGVVRKSRRWYVNVPKLKAWILAGDQAA